MRSLVFAELRSRVRSLSAIAVGVFLLLFTGGATYQSFGGPQMASEMFGGEPPAALMALSGSRSTDLFSPKRYIGLGFNHPLFLALTLSVAIAIGARAIAGDVETKRAQLLYSRPVARSRILLAHGLLWLASQVVVIAAAVAGAMVGSQLSPDLRAAGVGANLIWVGVQYFGVAAVFAGASFTSSALLHSRSAALGAAVGVAALSYLINFVSLLWSPLEALGKATPFGYYEPLEVSSGGLAVGKLAVLLGVAVVLFVATDVVLEHRDLA